MPTRILTPVGGSRDTLAVICLESPPIRRATLISLGLGGSIFYYQSASGILAPSRPTALAHRAVSTGYRTGPE
jgi:hypothetical protein